MSATIEIQIRQYDETLQVRKSPCSLTIECQGNRLVFADAVNGTEHVVERLVALLTPKPEPDPYAERYEALGLPDGWAMTYGEGVTWNSNEPPQRYVASSLRRILNRKAYKPGQEPKEKP